MELNTIQSEILQWSSSILLTANSVFHNSRSVSIQTGLFEEWGSKLIIAARYVMCSFDSE